MDKNAKIYVVNHELGFYLVNTMSSMIRGKTQSPFNGKTKCFPRRGGCLNQTATILRVAFS
jgi:hypothetical protein